MRARAPATPRGSRARGRHRCVAPLVSSTPFRGCARREQTPTFLSQWATELYVSGRGEATLASWGQPTPTTSQLHLIHVDFLPAKTPAKKHRDPGTPHSAAQNAMAQRVFTPLLLSILNSHQRKYETHAVQPVLAYHVHTRSPYLYVLPVGRQGWRLASSK